MKFTVTQEVFKKALEIGALAATSDTAQLDDESIELLIRSVKISVDETLLVQSGHNLLATKYSLEAEKKTGISVTEKGSILVPAKELLKWVNAQGKNSTINVELEESPSPTTIDIQSEQDGEEVAKFSIKKIGTVKLISQDTSKTVGKWELDCYDPEQAIQISFDDNDKGEHLFDIQAQKLTHALSKVSCATLDSDYNHIKDSVSIQNHNGEIFFATTDTKRCALYKGTNIDNIDSEKNALVPMRLLTLASKVLEVEGRTSLYYNEDGCKVYLSQKNVDVRITCPDKDTVAKFEDISKLLDKKYVDAGEIEKSQFMKMLTSSALVNKRAVLFVFDKDKKSVTLKASSENGLYKPSITKAEIEGVEQSARVVWSAEHLIDLLKVVKSGNVAFMLPDNLRSVKILSDEEPNLIYFLMSINNHKYDNA